MNQATNLIQWKNLTEEQKADFDFKDCKYEQQLDDGSWITIEPWGAFGNIVYRLKIEPEKWYYFECQGQSHMVTGKLIVNQEDAEILRPARKDEIPKQETLEDKIKAKWPDKEVAMLEWAKVPSIEKELLQMFGHINHSAASSMKGFYRYVYENKNGIYIDRQPTGYCDETTNATMPVAVLFEGGEK